MKLIACTIKYPNFIIHAQAQDSTGVMCGSRWQLKFGACMQRRGVIEARYSH
jgi:hypothetical protein